MERSLECPNCGGSLPDLGIGGVVTCTYCGSKVRTGEGTGNDQPSLPEDARSRIEALLRKGSKIEAIKTYREHVPGTLKESKLAVESIAREIGLTVRSGSCSAVLAVTLLMIAASAALLIS